MHLQETVDQRYRLFSNRAVGAFVLVGVELSLPVVFYRGG